MAWVSRIACLLLAASATAQGGDDWTTSYDEALKASAAQHKPMLILFGAEWCGWCKAMERDSFNDPDVKPLLEGFIKAKIDIDQASRVAFAYEVKSVPRLIATNIHGEVTADQLGYLDADQLAEFLQAVRSEADKRTGGPRLPEVPPEDAADKPAANKGEPRADIVQSWYGGDAMAALADVDPQVRAAAAEMLVARGQAAVPALREALAGDYLGLRIAAWEALQTLKAAPRAYDPWAPRDERLKALGKSATPRPRVEQELPVVNQFPLLESPQSSQGSTAPPVVPAPPSP